MTPEEEVFRRAYEHLALLGCCDGAGGAEYQRLWTLYRLTPHGMHENEFIYWQANRGAFHDKNGK